MQLLHFPRPRWSPRACELADLAVAACSRFPWSPRDIGIALDRVSDLSFFVFLSGVYGFKATEFSRHTLCIWHGLYFVWSSVNWPVHDTQSTLITYFTQLHLAFSHSVPTHKRMWCITLRSHIINTHFCPHLSLFYFFCSLLWIFLFADCLSVLWHKIPLTHFSFKHPCLPYISLSHVQHTAVSNWQWKFDDTSDAQKKSTPLSWPADWSKTSSVIPWVADANALKSLNW